MAATSYNYSISADFPNEAVSGSKLAAEIRLSAIVTALESIDTNGDDCEVTFKDALSAGDQTILDGLVAAHDGVTADSEEPTYSALSGGMVIAPSYSQFDEDAQFYGVRVECPAHTVTFHDIEITTELYVDHGMCWFKDANDGDIVEISVVDKDDVLGLFSILGYTVGVDILELGKWAENIPMFPGDTPWTVFHTEDTAPIVQGLYLRIKYDNNHATQQAIMGMTFNWFKSGS